MDDPTDNVTPLFPVGIPPERLILACNCGCETYKLFANGTMECAYCEAPVSADEEHMWRENMPLVAESSVNLTEPVHDVNSSYLGTATFARKRVLREIDKWSNLGRLVLIIGYNDKGGGHSWVNFETEDQRQWVMERLEQLKRYVEDFDLGTVKHAVYFTEEDPNAPVEAEDGKQSEDRDGEGPVSVLQPDGERGGTGLRTEGDRDVEDAVGDTPGGSDRGGE